MQVHRKESEKLRRVVARGLEVTEEVLREGEDFSE